MCREGIAFRKEVHKGTFERPMKRENETKIKVSICLSIGGLHNCAPQDSISNAHTTQSYHYQHHLPKHKPLCFCPLISPTPQPVYPSCPRYQLRVCSGETNCETACQALPRRDDCVRFANSTKVRAVRIKCIIRIAMAMMKLVHCCGTTTFWALIVVTSCVGSKMGSQS